MLYRNSIRTGVAAMAILFTTALNNNVLAAPIFATGDFITLRQTEWDVASMLSTPQPFSTVFPTALIVGTLGVPNRYSIILTNGPAVQGYLATGGPNTALTANHFDPTLPFGGQFGGELVALTLNVGFSDAGLFSGNLGIPFGDLTLTDLAGLPSLEGVSVRDFASIANHAIAGDATGFSLDDLTLISAQLNSSFLPAPSQFQGPSQFAEDHLRFTRSPTQVPEPATAGLVLLGLLALGLVRRRSRV